MLIKCPECELQISDKAIMCPHCGLPLVKEVAARMTRKKNNKRRKLPNGYGQICEIKGKYLRKPFRAMVTMGKTDTGKCIVKLLKPQAYFETYNEAYEALMEYHKNPYDLDSSSITVEQLYEKWSEKYFEGISNNAIRTVKAAWRYCGSIKAMRVSDLRARHIKGCIDDATADFDGEIRSASPSTKGRMKSLFNMMLDYAIEYEIVQINYARTFDLSKDITDEKERMKNPHIPYTDDEIQKLWENINEVAYVNVVLLQCYMGWRPQELGLIELSNVDLDNWTITGGMKTVAGRNRVVPVHPAIRNIVQNLYDEATELGSEYLINCPDSVSHKGNLKFTYDKYRHRFDKIVKRLDLNEHHRAHDARKHFITIAKKYNVDEYAIKYMVGHEINDVTEKVYTVRELEWLHKEMQKIKVDVKKAAI